MNKRQFICQSIVSFLLLGLGGSIYLLFRPKTLLMFKWVDSLGLSEYVDRLRDLVSGIILNHITLYSLPDGLWLASYIIVVNTIVSKNNKYNLLFWSLLLSFIAIVFELLQIPGIIPGVFDVFDLICYIVPLIIYFFPFQSKRLREIKLCLHKIKFRLRVYKRTCFSYKSRELGRFFNL